MEWRTLIVGAAGLSAMVLWHHLAPLVRWRISSLVRTSRTHYAAKKYEESLAAAVTAKELAAKELGEASATHRQVLFHLAAVYSAMRRLTDAIFTLRQCDVLACDAHGTESLQRVPIFNAMAEVHEAEDTEAGARQALEVLQKCRDLRLLSLGDAHLDYAFSCFNEANLLVRIANDTVMMPAEKRVEQTERAVTLAIEAHNVAGNFVLTNLTTHPALTLAAGLTLHRPSTGRAGDAEQGAEFLDTLLVVILKDGCPNRLAAMPQCACALQKLREAGACYRSDAESDDESADTR